MDEPLVEDYVEAWEQGPAGYVTTQAGGLIVRANRTFLGWTGYVETDLVGRRRLQDLFTMPGRIYFETHLGPLLAMQGSLSEIAIDVIRPGAAPLPAMLNAALKRRPDGTAQLVRFTVFNATERRRYERQLLEARRQAQAASEAKAELLATLSHDIRTPLGSISAVAHLLELTPLTPQQQSAVRILKTSSAAVLGLVNQILDHGRLEAGELSVQARPFDLGTELGELASMFEPTVQAKGIALRCELVGTFPGQVVGDPARLRQILGNLVANAVKFTERGSVTLEARLLECTTRAVHVRLRVVDTGIGIAQDALHRIFEKYGQANADIAVRYGGTGLGLAICRKLLKGMGSELHVRSSLGEGTEFWFDLALGLPDAAR